MGKAGDPCTVQCWKHDSAQGFQRLLRSMPSLSADGHSPTTTQERMEIVVGMKISVENIGSDVSNQAQLSLRGKTSTPSERLDSRGIPRWNSQKYQLFMSKWIPFLAGAELSMYEMGVRFSTRTLSFLEDFEASKAPDFAASLSTAALITNTKPKLRSEPAMQIDLFRSSQRKIPSMHSQSSFP